MSPHQQQLIWELDSCTRDIERPQNLNVNALCLLIPWER